jgi:hypothetical protein
LLSIVWILAGYALIINGAILGHLVFNPEWLFLCVGLVVWLGGGLVLAIAGLRGGNVAGRIAGLVGAAIFSYFAWQMAWPILHRPHPIIGRERLNYGDALIYNGAPFCCIYVGLETNEAPLFDKAFWRIAEKYNIRKPSRHYLSYSGPPRATCHNDHVSLFVASIPTDRIVSQYVRLTQADTDSASWQAGIWSDAYWPTNASRITKNGRELLAPLTGSIRLGSNDTNYSVKDFKHLCDSLTNDMQSAFPDRAVRSFYYDGDKP